MLKKCCRCKLDKVLGDFYKSGGYCRECRAAYAREYYRQSRPRRKRNAYQRSLMRARYAKNKAFVDSWKSERGCSKCGEKRAPCLDLHHTEYGSKRHAYDLLSAKGKYWGRKRTISALETAEVLCANCHRWLHYQERLVGTPVSRTGNKLGIDTPS